MGPGGAAQIAKQVPEMGVLVLTMHDSEQVMCEVLQAGARGLVLKSDADRDLLAAEAVAKKRHLLRRDCRSLCWADTWPTLLRTRER